MPVIALDLGGTKLASAIISPFSRILRRNVVLLQIFQLTHHASRVTHHVFTSL
jgi:hypothetical protein